MTWYQKLVTNLIMDSQNSANLTAQGISLQISDIFLKEMNNVDSDISLDDLAAVLDPFLKSLGKIHNGELKERIIEQVFNPLLENNKTIKEESEDEEEMKKREQHHRLIDGGKLNPKTQKEI